MLALLASIPSPSSGTFDIFGRAIHMYGLMLLLAIVACIALTWYRWKNWGGDPDLVLRVAVWGVAAGIIGARAYHDVTSWNEVPKKWWGPFAVWEGGLGVWGGILLGTLVGAFIVRRSGASVRLFLDAAAPGLLLAQGIGRWGNWWNQELYGKPTDLSWGVEIDFVHRVPGYEQYSTFHPTFLYEFVYDVVGAGILLAVGRFFRIRPPGLFALYVSYYCVGRFFEELLRIDPAHEFLGLRLNAWVSIVVFVISTAFFIWWQFIRDPEPGEPAATPSQRKAPEGPAMAIPKGRVR
ncbi:MAG: prolipoprotein diacylglyceryl transferase [Actinomycetota bacterium]|nr:prolipoprotein diacylglyceryl transferase [Actinomycetota bacterium]